MFNSQAGRLNKKPDNFNNVVGNVSDILVFRAEQKFEYPLDIVRENCNLFKKNIKDRKAAGFLNIRPVIWKTRNFYSKSAKYVQVGRTNDRKLHTYIPKKGVVGSVK